MLNQREQNPNIILLPSLFLKRGYSKKGNLSSIPVKGEVKSLEKHERKPIGTEYGEYDQTL